MKARTNKKPLFLYIHDHKDDSCANIDKNILPNASIHSKLKNKFICFGSNIHSKEGTSVKNKIDPQMVPFIALFHVANDNQLDYIGSLTGEDITLSALNQTLTLATDMHFQLLNSRPMPKKEDKKEVPNFIPRKEKQKTKFFRK